MNIRRILLLLMLAALGGCAALGAMALIVPFGEFFWRLAGTAFFTAIACGILMPLSFLVDRPKVRLGGMVGMATIIICWLATLIAIWFEGLGLGNDIGWRALAIVGQTLLVGLPLTGALLLVSFDSARVAVWTLTGVCIAAYGCFVLGSMLPESRSFYLPFGQLAQKLWATGWFIEWVGVVAAALLVNVGRDRRYFRWAGMICAAAGFAIAIIGIWLEVDDSYIGTRVMALSLIAAVAMAHVNLVMMARLKDWQRFIQWGTIAVALVSALSASQAILWSETDESILVRLAGAGAIAAACGSVAVIILSLFNRTPQHPSNVATEFTELLLQCPNCGSKQRLPIGAAACGVCNLQIFTKVMEPRRPGCGYLLYRMASDRCPECGMVVRAAGGAGLGTGAEGIEPVPAPAGATSTGGPVAPA